MLPTFDVPAIGPKQSKVWGDTQLIFVHHGVECHKIGFLRGGFCSQHRHQYKWNRFVVLEGRLLVRIFQSFGKVDETTIGAGQITDVPPLVQHQFEGLDDGTALEFYWTVLDAGDIEREDAGGMKDVRV
jgi:mannose-6-phosphate isomerase-like protein (cupin superfamily)